VIGVSIKSGNNSYTILRELAVLGRTNANVYLCEDELKNKYVAKHFYSGACQPYVTRGKYNHFGRRRDGNQTVFDEIREKCRAYSFLVNHIERIRYNGKWIIILEYIEGTTLREYFINHGETEPEKVKKALRALAETLSLWHQYGFALGDAHLDNAMVQFDEQGTCHARLIDYSLLHHKDFYYCRQFKCFEPDPLRRIKEDLENDFGNLGNGFRYDIMEVQKEQGWDNSFLDTFDQYYRSPE
jgi:serine/threonine protein kinase